VIIDQRVFLKCSIIVLPAGALELSVVLRHENIETLCARLSESFTPSITTTSQEIIVFEGETIQINCTIENLREYLMCLNRATLHHVTVLHYVTTSKVSSYIQGPPWRNGLDKLYIMSR